LCWLVEAVVADTVEEVVLVVIVQPVLRRLTLVKYLL
jgi:hypothetical protein